MSLRRLIIIIFSSAVLLGCQGEPAGLVKEEDVVLVTVDGRPISLPMLEYMMSQRGVSADDHQAMRALLDELIRLAAVANAAEREGIADEPAVRAHRLLRDLEALQLAYFSHIHEQFPVSEADIQATYQTQISRSGSRQFRLETIVFASQAEALLAIAAIEEGEQDFERLAASVSASGGLVEPTGWIDRSQLGPELAPLLEEVTAGEVLPAPLQTPQGWRLLRVSEERPLEAPALETVREGIARQLVRQRLEALVEDLYEGADIVPMLPLEDAGNL